MRTLVRAGNPEGVTKQMTGHTRPVFERYNVVSEFDLVEAARKRNILKLLPSSGPAEAGHYV